MENPMPVMQSPASLKKLILKLRWIGLESEAANLQGLLFRIAPDECAGMWPSDTD